jgi:hypothetical protein
MGGLPYLRFPGQASADRWRRPAACPCRRADVARPPLPACSWIQLGSTSNVPNNDELKMVRLLPAAARPCLPLPLRGGMCVAAARATAVPELQGGGGGSGAGRRACPGSRLQATRPALALPPPAGGHLDRLLQHIRRLGARLRRHLRGGHAAGHRHPPRVPQGARGLAPGNSCLQGTAGSGGQPVARPPTHTAVSDRDLTAPPPPPPNPGRSSKATSPSPRSWRRRATPPSRASPPTWAPSASSRWTLEAPTCVRRQQQQRRQRGRRRRGRRPAGAPALRLPPAALRANQRRSGLPASAPPERLCPRPALPTGTCRSSRWAPTTPPRSCRCAGRRPAPPPSTCS